MGNCVAGAMRAFSSMPEMPPVEPTLVRTQTCTRTWNRTFGFFAGLERGSRGAVLLVARARSAGFPNAHSLWHSVREHIAVFIGAVHAAVNGDWALPMHVADRGSGIPRAIPQHVSSQRIESDQSAIHRDKNDAVVHDRRRALFRFSGVRAPRVYQAAYALPIRFNAICEYAVRHSQKNPRTFGSVAPNGGRGVKARTQIDLLQLTANAGKLCAVQQTQHVIFSALNQHQRRAAAPVSGQKRRRTAA